MRWIICSPRRIEALAKTELALFQKGHSRESRQGEEGKKSVEKDLFTQQQEDL